MSSTVRIYWDRKYDNVLLWNEVCAWAVEYFGLPGDRFETHVNVNYMEFIFKDSRDALMMSVRWNAPIISDYELTVETVGKFL